MESITPQLLQTFLDPSDLLVHMTTAAAANFEGQRSQQPRITHYRNWSRMILDITYTVQKRSGQFHPCNTFKFLLSETKNSSEVEKSSKRFNLFNDVPRLNGINLYYSSCWEPRLPSKDAP